jgi:hypothetical protein
LRAEGFSCRLNISKLLFLIKKRYKKISAVCFPVFGHQDPGFGLDLNPDPDSLEMLVPDSYPDPQLYIHRVLM